MIFIQKLFFASSLLALVSCEQRRQQFSKPHPKAKKSPMSAFAFVLIRPI